MAKITADTYQHNSLHQKKAYTFSYFWVRESPEPNVAFLLEGSVHRYLYPLDSVTLDHLLFLEKEIGDHFFSESFEMGHPQTKLRATKILERLGEIFHSAPSGS